MQKRDGAEDISQEVFFELYRSMQKIQSSEHLVNWLRRTTLNRCIDRSRRSATRHEAAWSDGYEPVSMAPDHDVLARNTVRDLVGRLPETQRAVLLLRYTEDLLPSEIAQTLQLPLNTVKSHLQRALLALRKRFEVRKVSA